MTAEVATTVVDARAGLEGVTVRPETEADATWLLAIYASTRAHEMALVDWTDAQKQDFLRMQFDAQHRYYTSAYPGATFDLIERHGQPIGRLYLHERDADVRIVDIALLPEARGQGIGTALLRDVIARAEARARRVSIHVEHDNPARRLYERLGFRPVEARGFYLLMESTPGGGSGA